MPVPTHKVELAFGTSGFIDVTQYVQNVSINRGISRVLDDYSAGSCSVTFVNNDRIFDPTNGNTNLVSNFSFETNITGWDTYLASTLSRSTTVAYAGVASLKHTSLSPFGAYVCSTLNNIPVVENKVYSASAYVRTEVFSTTMTIGINWWNSAGGIISQPASSPVSVNSTSWTRATLTTTAPAGAVFGQVVFITQAAGSGSESAFYDLVVLEQRDSVGSPFFDLVKPGGLLRVSSTGIVSHRRFTGIIQDWDFNYEESGFDATATLTALDMMYRVSNASFTGGTAWQVESTSNRIKTVMNDNGFDAADYAGVRGGQTLLGYDVNEPGDNVLAYLQNVARSEPADFYSNASAVMQLKDRSFTNYAWTNSMRYNFVAYPATATLISNDNLNTGWNLIGSPATATPSLYGGVIWRGGTVADPFVPSDSLVGFEYRDFTPGRYNETGLTYTFAGSLRGVNGTYNISAFLLNNDGGVQSATAITVSSTATTQWVNYQVSMTGASAVGGVQFVANVTGGTAFTVIGDGFIIEPAGTSVNYFDGTYNPYATTATTAYETAWSGDVYASQSGLLTSVASAITAPAVLIFADANSQGTAFGNGTGIPFTNLEVVYGSEQLYNKVQVVGINATAVVEDAASQLLYGLRGYGQTDNLTTSTTKPAQIASAFLGEFRLPEYRAQALTVALESLTTTQQTAVLGIEIRDVVRVCFQPSAQGGVVDKYYQVLGVNSNTDVERDAITLNLASLDNLPFRLDSPYLGVLDTGILA